MLLVALALGTGPVGSGLVHQARADEGGQPAVQQGPIEEARLQALQKELDGAVAAMGASRVGVHVVDLETGQTLYTKRTDEAFNPASNVKLFTSAAALDKLGPQHTFITQILGKAPDEQGVVRGGLTLRGTGEGFLLFEDLLSWAASLKQQGVKKVEGGVRVDDTAFEGDYLPPGFDQKDEDASYRAPIGAMSVNFNSVDAIVEPAAQAGEAARVRLDPPNDHVVVDNQARTVAGSGARIRVRSRPNDSGGTTLTVLGTIGTGSSSVSTRKRIDNPPLFAGAVLVEALKMVGVEVEGPVTKGVAPGGARELVRHRSDALTYLVSAMNKWSSNFMAEQLLRALGRTNSTPSTVDRSREAVTNFLERVGVTTKGLALHNGSGLYAGNEVSPRQVVELLMAMHQHPAGPEFKSSLAVASRDGTLRNRLPSAAGRVRGKTGTLNRVTALSGYALTPSNRQLAFSILVNDTPTYAWNLRDEQDQIARIIASFDG